MASNGSIPSGELVPGEKAVSEEVVRRSVVEAADAAAQAGTTLGMGGLDQSLILWVASQGETISPFGRAPKVRDRQLREFYPSENYLLSALTSVAAANSAFSWKLEGDDALVRMAQDMLLNANRGAGWEDFATRFTMDLSTQDNGAFVEIIRAGDSEESPVINFGTLDSARCYQTGDPMTPVIYRDRKGKLHLLKWFQVAHILELPSPQEHPLAGAYYRLQYSAVTRVLRAAQIIKNVSIYKDEKIAGRFLRAIHLLQGVTPQQVSDAMGAQEVHADQQGLLRYMQPLMVSSIDPKAEVGHDTVELASLPEGWDEEHIMKWYLTALAMGLLRDYQDFAPLPGGGLGTSQQSQVLHMKSRGKGPGLWMKLIAHLMNFRGILPQNVTFSWDEQDVEADKAQADLEKLNADARAIRISSGELDAIAAMQIAVDKGELKQEIYDDLIKRIEEQQRRDEEREIAEREHAVAVDFMRYGGAQDAGPADADITASDNQPPAGKRPQSQKGRKFPPSRRKLENDVEDEIMETLDGVFSRISSRMDELGEPSQAVRSRRPAVVEEQRVIRDKGGRIDRVVTTRRG